MKTTATGLQPGTIIKDSAQELTAFDLWLKENYTDAYNIDFKYKWDDGETLLDYNLCLPPSIIPPGQAKSSNIYGLRLTMKQ
jgi:hypothetical protein